MNLNHVQKVNTRSVQAAAAVVSVVEIAVAAATAVEIVVAVATAVEIAVVAADITEIFNFGLYFQPYSILRLQPEDFFIDAFIVWGLWLGVCNHHN
jgi:nucleoside recognition membrane protein YjiH